MGKHFSCSFIAPGSRPGAIFFWSQVETWIVKCNPARRELAGILILLIEGVCKCIGVGYARPRWDNGRESWTCLPAGRSVIVNRSLDVIEISSHARKDRQLRIIIHFSVQDAYAFHREAHLSIDYCVLNIEYFFYALLTLAHSPLPLPPVSH